MFKLSFYLKRKQAMERVNNSLDKRVDEISREFSKLFSLSEHLVHDQYGGIKNAKVREPVNRSLDMLRTTKNFIQ